MGRWIAGPGTEAAGEHLRTDPSAAWPSERKARLVSAVPLLERLLAALHDLDHVIDDVVGVNASSSLYACRARARGIEHDDLLRITIDEVGRRYLAQLTAAGRRRSTLQDYRSYLRVHLVPFFDDMPVESIRRGDVEQLVAEKLGDGLAPKSVRNYLGLLHSLFAYAEGQEWTRGNPCKLVEKPGEDEGDADIRFLDDQQLDALLRAVPNERLGWLDRVLYLPRR
jgi:Phage integrase, N-terminal SAM-like domain